MGRIFGLNCYNMLMDTKQARHVRRQFRAVNKWYFLVGAIVCGIIGVFALRQNNLNAIALRDKVSQADKANGDVEGALRELREYTYAHMNTSLKTDTGTQHPIQLKYRYERLLKAEKDRVAKSNENIYTRAQKHCEARYPAWTLRDQRVPCIQKFIRDNGGEQERPIPDALYKFDFVAPAWSADLAGLSLIVSVVL